MTELITFIQKAIKNQFNGYLQINFNKGVIAGINKFEANIKIEDLATK